MIPIDTETLLTFPQAARRFPSRTGRALHVSTIHRWAAGGARGVRLESVLVGGVRMTSVEALQRFVNRLSAGREPGQSPADRKGHEAAEKALAAKGFDG